MVKEKKSLSTMGIKDDQIVQSVGDRVYPADAKFDERVSAQDMICFYHIFEKLFTKHGWDSFPALAPKIDKGCV